MKLNSSNNKSEAQSLKCTYEFTLLKRTICFISEIALRISSVIKGTSVRQSLHNDDSSAKWKYLQDATLEPFC